MDVWRAGGVVGDALRPGHGRSPCQCRHSGRSEYPTPVLRLLLLLWLLSWTGLLTVLSSSGSDGRRLHARRTSADTRRAAAPFHYDFNKRKCTSGSSNFGTHTRADTQPRGLTRPVSCGAAAA